MNPFTHDYFVELARGTRQTLLRDTRQFGIKGLVGDALFACALSRIDRDAPVNFWLSRAIDRFNERIAGPSLHGGLAGLGLVLATYADANELLSEIDGVLLAHVPRVAPASMQSGVAGIAMYASLRSHADSGKRLQDAVVAALSAAATASGEGVLWNTPVAYARARDVDVVCEPVTELGMVHGMGGTLVALSALAARGRDDAADLARAGLRAAWARERTGWNRFGRIEFGAHGAEGSLEFDDRRWCVGDHGILPALWLTATTLGEAPFAERALLLLRENAARDSSGPIPGVPGRFNLCCGSSVIAQVYLRMYLATGEPVFREANERLLATCAEAVAGLQHPSFGYGRAGVLLALLSPRAEEEPIWDSMLGLSLPRAVHELAA